MQRRTHATCRKAIVAALPAEARKYAFNKREFAAIDVRSDPLLDASGQGVPWSGEHISLSDLLTIAKPDETWLLFVYDPNDARAIVGTADVQFFATGCRVSYRPG